VHAIAGRKGGIRWLSSNALLMPTGPRRQELALVDLHDSRVAPEEVAISDADEESVQSTSPIVCQLELQWLWRRGARCA